MFKFGQFTNDEVYVLKRMAIESSYEFFMDETKQYGEKNQRIHNKLLNELVEECKRRNKDGK